MLETDEQKHNRRSGSEPTPLEAMQQLFPNEVVFEYIEERIKYCNMFKPFQTTLEIIGEDFSWAMKNKGAFEGKNHYGSIFVMKKVLKSQKNLDIFKRYCESKQLELMQQYYFKDQ